MAAPALLPFPAQGWTRCTGSRVAFRAHQAQRFSWSGLPPTRKALPELQSLASFGRAWRGGLPDETDEETVARVFGSVETRSVAPASGPD
jgi:hypothetical protein